MNPKEFEKFAEIISEKIQKYLSKQFHSKHVDTDGLTNDIVDLVLEEIEEIAEVEEEEND